MWIFNVDYIAVFLSIDSTYFILHVFHGISHDFFLPVPY